MRNYSQLLQVNYTHVYLQGTGKEEVRKANNRSWNAAPLAPITQINELMLGFNGKPHVD